MKAPLLSLASHINPYPHYQAIREAGALQFDPELGIWIASSAEVVQMILEMESCVVRPPAEKIPSNIAAGKAGEVFGHLVRMNEGRTHQPAKHVLQTTLQSIDFNLSEVHASALLTKLAGDHALQSGLHLNRWMVAFPVSVVGHLCGFADAQLAPLVCLMDQFVAALSPLSRVEQIEQAHQAADQLHASFVQLLKDTPAVPTSFLHRLQLEAAQSAWSNNAVIVSNLIGLLSQTYEATAGLIGNSLVSLQARPELREQLVDAPEKLHELIAEVVRFDPSVQNTRRFVTENIDIAGHTLKAGDVVLLLLAAANRDPAFNEHPETFLLERRQRRSFTFSHGRHQCPGQQLAMSITSCALSFVLANSQAAQWQALRWQYRPSLNGRIPLFNQ